MGDISEMRGLIVVFCIIAVAITLIALMPPEFYLASATSPTTSTTNPYDLIAWNQTYILNITDTTEYLFQVAGWNVRVDKWAGLSCIFIETYESWWIFDYNYDPFRWFKNGIDVSRDLSVSAFIFWHTTAPVIEISQLDADFASGAGLKYQIQNGKTQWDVSFVFNSTAFSKPSDAYVGNELYMVFQLDFNDRNTSINALNLIGMLFTASLPNVDPTINLLTSFPIWACTGYLIFIFVLRIIGAVFGGGGA